MNTTVQIMTAEELFILPDDGYRYELVKGELQQMSPTGYKHGRIGSNLTLLLANYVKANSLGVVLGAETGFKLTTNPDTVRAPDIAFIRQERINEAGDPESYWLGAPDLAVEVLSPTDRTTEIEEKVEAFLRAGASAVLVLSPKLRCVTVYQSLTKILVLTIDDVLEGGEILPGFKVAVREIFA